MQGPDKLSPNSSGVKISLEQLGNKPPICQSFGHRRETPDYPLPAGPLWWPVVLSAERKKNEAALLQ